MEVILKEDVNKLGHRGDVVKVAAGYGRNYLLPGKLAMEATPANKVVIDQMKASAIRKSASEKGGAEELAAKLNEVVLTFERKTGENEHLFGSVTSQDIAHELEAQGYKVDRRKIHLENPLRTVGEFHVPIKLHREVSAHVQVNIKSDAPERATEATEVEDDTAFKSTYHGEVQPQKISNARDSYAARALLSAARKSRTAHSLCRLQHSGCILETHPGSRPSKGRP
jgi:large subunit ribosomal protein L9